MKRSHMSIAVAHGRINKMADSHGQKKGPFRNPCPMPGPYSVGHPFPIPFALAHNDMSSAKCKTGRHRTFRQLFVLVVGLVLRLLVLLAPRPCCTYNSSTNTKDICRATWKQSSLPQSVAGFCVAAFYLSMCSDPKRPRPGKAKPMFWRANKSAQIGQTKKRWAVWARGAIPNPGEERTTNVQHCQRHSACHCNPGVLKSRNPEDVSAADSSGFGSPAVRLVKRTAASAV